MKVKELRKIIENIDPELEIILQADPEGNSYDKLYAVDSDCIFSNDIVYSTKWSAEDAIMDEDEWEEFKKENPRCLVLAP